MNNSDKTIEELKKISLTSEEKNAIRGRVADFASSNLISIKSINNMENNFGTNIPTSSSFAWSSFIYKIAVPALLLLVVVGGGTSYLAEKSLPGDALYPVKLNVNEKMQSVLAFNEKDSAMVDLNQAVRRLTEAETLALSGKLTAEQDSEIKTNFSKEVESFNSQVSKIESKGDTKTADEVKIKFKKEMDDHEKILAGYSSKSSTTIGVLDVVRLAKGDKEEGEDNGGLAIAGSENARAKTFATIRKDNEGQDDHAYGEKENDDDEGDEGDEAPMATLSVGASASATVAPATTTSQTFTMAEVSKHNLTTNCYSVVSGSVYDLTKWISKHPGGEGAIKSMCGVDATSAFNDQYGGQSNPTRILQSYKIGVIKK